MFLLRDDISHIARLLESGGLICYPTDTVWGIGCDALNPQAIERVTALKGGKPHQGYITLVDDLPMLRRYVPEIHPRLETLLAYHKRPLTIIYPKVQGLPDALRGDDGSAAIRIVQDAFCQEIIRVLDRPLLSTTACKIDEPFPPHFGAISSEVISGVDYVAKHRREERITHQPSSIARLDRHLELEFLRD